MTSHKKNACKWLLKQHSHAHQVEESASPVANANEGPGVSPSAFVDFRIEQLLDETIEDSMRELDERSSDHCSTDYFLVSATIVESLWSNFDTLFPQLR